MLFYDTYIIRPKANTFVHLMTVAQNLMTVAQYAKILERLLYNLIFLFCLWFCGVTFRMDTNNLEPKNQKYNIPTTIKHTNNNKFEINPLAFVAT